jgi:type IV pilus assembly protein PilA
MNKQKEKGFTLLELMVTVAIVGILAAIAIPIYNNYITKTRIADALTHGRVYAGKVTIDKEDVVEAPSGLEYSKIKLAGSQKKPRVRIKLKKTIDSTVLMDPDDRAGGKVIVLSEESSDASVQWACTTNLPQALIPKGCTYEAGVGQRKLLAEWTEGNDACWSPERAAAGKSGWAVGPCSSCTQARTQQKAESGNAPGPVDKPMATCSGQYIDDETLALIEAAEEAARVAEEEAASGPTAWDLLSEKEQASETACWDQAVSEESLAADGDGNGWVAGLNKIDDFNRGHGRLVTTQITARDLAVQHGRRLRTAHEGSSPSDNRCIQNPRVGCSVGGVKLTAAMKCVSP